LIVAVPLAALIFTPPALIGLGLPLIASTATSLSQFLAPE